MSKSKIILSLLLFLITSLTKTKAASFRDTSITSNSPTNLNLKPEVQKGDWVLIVKDGNVGYEAPDQQQNFGQYNDNNGNDHNECRATSSESVLVGIKDPMGQIVDGVYYPNFTRAYVREVVNYQANRGPESASLQASSESQQTSDSESSQWRINVLIDDQQYRGKQNRPTLSGQSTMAMRYDDLFVKEQDIVVIKQDLVTVLELESSSQSSSSSHQIQSQADYHSRVIMHIKENDQVIFSQAKNFPSVRIFRNDELSYVIDFVENGTIGRVLEIHQGNNARRNHKNINANNSRRFNFNVRVEYWTQDGSLADGWCKIDNLTVPGRLSFNLTIPRNPEEWDQKYSQFVRQRLESATAEGFFLEDSDNNEKFKDNVIVLDGEFILDPACLNYDSSGLILDRSTFRTLGFFDKGRTWKHPLTRREYGPNRTLLYGNEIEDLNSRDPHINDTNSSSTKITDIEYEKLVNYRNLINHFRSEFIFENGVRPKK